MAAPGPKVPLQRTEICFFIKMRFYLNAKVRKIKSGPKGELLTEISGFPSRLPGAPSPALSLQPVDPASALRGENYQFQSRTRN